MITASVEIKLKIGKKDNINHISECGKEANRRSINAFQRQNTENCFKSYTWSFTGRLNEQIFLNHFNV